tara:strand:+ start:11429 stop:11674 length:246 start_codon:yes stop_codon:yes gene_type:complete
MHQRNAPPLPPPPTHKSTKPQNAPTHFASDAMRNEYYKLYTCDSELKNIAMAGIEVSKNNSSKKNASLLYLLDNFLTRAAG